MYPDTDDYINITSFCRDIFRQFAYFETFTMSAGNIIPIENSSFADRSLVQTNYQKPSVGFCGGLSQAGLSIIR